MTTDCSWNYHDLLSYCGLVDATISASEKDLPVPVQFISGFSLLSSYLLVSTIEWFIYFRKTNSVINSNRIDNYVYRDTNRTYKLWLYFVPFRAVKYNGPYDMKINRLFDTWFFHIRIKLRLVFYYFTPYYEIQEI